MIKDDYFARIGLFPMVGDLCHVGHLTAIKEAKRHCIYLIIALNADPTIDNPNKQKPVESLYERWERLKSNKYVDEVIPYCGEKDLELLIKTTTYDIRFVGDDHSETWTGKEFEEQNNIRSYIINRCHGLSSTNLKKRINKVENEKR